MESFVTASILTNNADKNPHFNNEPTGTVRIFMDFESSFTSTR